MDKITREDSIKLFGEVINYWNTNYTSYPKFIFSKELFYSNISFNGWNEKLHYEFARKLKTSLIGIELHNEKRNKNIDKIIEQFEGNKIKDNELEYHSVGKIRIVIPFNYGNKYICECMQELIELTKGQIDNCYHEEK